MGAYGIRIRAGPNSSCWNNSNAVRGWIKKQPYGHGSVDWAQPCENVGTKWNGSAFLNGTTGTASCVFDSVFQGFIMRTHEIAACVDRPLPPHTPILNVPSVFVWNVPN